MRLVGNESVDDEPVKLNSFRGIPSRTIAYATCAQLRLTGELKQRNDSMKTSSGLFYGNVSAELGKLLSQHFERLPPFLSAVILSIDSTRIPPDVWSILRRYGISSRGVATAPVLTSDELRDAANTGVFAGFDEVWLLDRKAHDRAVAQCVGLDSQLEGLEKCISQTEFSMTETGCVLALADGFNLSYATWDSSVAAFIESLDRLENGHG